MKYREDTASKIMMGSMAAIVGLMVGFGIYQSATAETAKKGASHPAVEVADPQAKRRADRYQWYPLRHDQATRLVEALKPLKAAHGAPIVILCGVPDCHELAQDIDTAFEDAGWKSDIEPPMLSSGEGMMVSDKDIAAAITKATGIRTVELPGWKDPRIAIVIGKKIRTAR